MKQTFKPGDIVLFLETTKMIVVGKIWADIYYVRVTSPSPPGRQCLWWATGSQLRKLKTKSIECRL
jgi:hypothetical protein